MQNNETMAGRHLSTQDNEDDRLVPSPRGSRQKHEQPRAKGVRGRAKKHLCVKRKKKTRAQTGRLFMGRGPNSCKHSSPAAALRWGVDGLILTTAAKRRFQ